MSLGISISRTGNRRESSRLFSRVSSFKCVCSFAWDDRGGLASFGNFAIFFAVMVVGNRAAAAFVVVAASATIFSTVFVSVLNWRRSNKFGCSFSWFGQSLAKSGERREPCGKEESRGGTEAVSSSFRQGVIGAIGNTPLIRIHSLSEATGCDIFGKAEFLNPGGSVKDRVAAKILDEALESGALQTGGLITEGSAGSTAVSLAMVAIAHGCKCHVVLPDDAAIEKTQILEAMGAVVERVRPVSISHREHFVNVARQRALEAQAIVEDFCMEIRSTVSDESQSFKESLNKGFRHCASGTHLRQAGTEDESCSQSKGGFFADQFENLANFRAHYEGTAPEIWAQTGGKVNAFVAAAGTGGTIAGVSCYLKEKNPEVKCYLIDPPGSGLYNSVTRGVMYTREEAEGKRMKNPFDTITEGIGINRITQNFKQAKLDGAFRGSDREAVEMARFLLKNDGLFVGSSSAMNCVGAVHVARVLGPGNTIVTILCDGGARHLSKFHNSSYLATQGLTPSATGLEFIKESVLRPAFVRN